MIADALAVLGFVKNLFTGGNGKYAIYAVLGVSVAIGIWWVMDEYGDMKAIIAKQEAAIENYEVANKSLAEHLENCSKEKDEMRDEYNTAIQNRKVLESKLGSTVKEKSDALEVFEKECGRIERLMQKKASLVVRFANRATDRLRLQFQEATEDNGSSGGVQEN